MEDKIKKMKRDLEIEHRCMQVYGLIVVIFVIVIAVMA